MAKTKDFLIVILFAAILISSYEVLARDIADPQSTRQTQSVEESKQSYAGGGYGNPGGGSGTPAEGYGNPGEGCETPEGGYGNPPPRQKMAKVVEEKRY